ncbi:uncharacterized protein ARMOST_19096 [Armillaria ostoyae]|uniref:Uncharacterized protein n=1 Tax=Armillaria ostoyae TaxID=47428 RepID=A0A284S3N5_ARMOS|nr:uncharacterized protein ARMOST_19096 [Armillaria ostoyae]
MAGLESTRTRTELCLRRATTLTSTRLPEYRSILTTLASLNFKPEGEQSYMRLYSVACVLAATSYLCEYSTVSGQSGLACRIPYRIHSSRFLQYSRRGMPSMSVVWGECYIDMA